MDDGNNAVDNTLAPGTCRFRKDGKSYLLDGQNCGVGKKPPGPPSAPPNSENELIVDCVPDLGEPVGPGGPTDPDGDDGGPTA